jgi:hypothetical protein
MGPLNTGLPDKYYLFYCKIRPEDYIFTRELDVVGFRRPSLEFEKQAYDNALYIAAPWDFSLDEVLDDQIVKSVDYPNGETAFLYVKTN